jgi:hypothetical protein
LGLAADQGIVALEGIELDDRDAERTGRFIAGVITLEQGIDEILRELGLTASG